MISWQELTKNMYTNHAFWKAFVRITVATVVVAVEATMVSSAIAASSWNPTLLVNTESFQVIDDGDSTTNVELRFGGTLNEKIFYNRTTKVFEMTRGLTVHGTVTATGAVIRGNMSGTSLRVDKGADIWGTLGVSGATVLKGTATISGLTTANAGLTVRGAMSGSTLRVDKGADIWGTLGVSGATVLKGTLNVNGAATFGSTIKLSGVTYTFPLSDGSASGKVLKTNGAGQLSWSDGGILQGAADNRYVKKSGDTMTGALRIANNAGLTTSGSIMTDNNITINRLNAAQDATMTFGNASGQQTIKFNNTTQRFEVSKNLKVNGSLSGSSLTVDGTVTIRGQTYNFPTNSGSSGQVLKTDGAGNLAWTSSTTTGSGHIVQLTPEYPYAVYFASGASIVGQLANAYDTTNKENYYHWTSSKASPNQYWMSVRVRVPSTFKSWDPSAPIQFRYRTGDASSTNNYVSMRLLDTANAPVTLTGAENLANVAWTTATITGPLSGTYTPGGYITLLFKFASNVTGSTDLATTALFWKTSAP